MPNMCHTLVILFILALNDVVTANENCICLSNFTTRLHNPIHVEFRNERFYVAEQRGMILFYKNKESEAKIFLDISGQVLKSTNPFSEQGLLGFVLHPRYDVTGKFYVFYMGETPNSKYSILSEFTAVDDFALPQTERYLMKIEKKSNAGNGGQLLFGKDGFLYISVGDGVGDVGITQDNAQNPTSFLGKILRIDVDAQSFSNGSALSYGVPPSNPFVNKSPWRPEIFAYGCRDMFRCSQDMQPDHKGEHRIFCGDPGARAYEEINMIKSGRNYGWDIKEGFNCYDSTRCTNGSLENEELPIHVYKHTQLHHSVVGGHVYRGSAIPFLFGKYVFGDALESFLKTLKEEGGKWTPFPLSVCDPVYCPCHARESLRSYLLAFSQDSKGEIYVLSTSTLTANVNDGAALKIVSALSHKTTCGANSPSSGMTFFISILTLFGISRLRHT